MNHNANNPSATTGGVAARRDVGRPIATWVVVSGVATLVLGSWAFFLPEQFFADFPLAGAHWVSTLGEFNDHLTRDFGAAQVGLGLMAILVASKRSRDGVVATMAGYVVFGALHLGYHFTTFDRFHTSSAAAQAVALATFVVIPLGVLLAVRHKEVERS